MNGSHVKDEKIQVKVLKESALLFPVCSEAGSLENRKIFIEQIFNDMVTNCPKNEPLVIISLGADRLLMEYILGSALIENGFEDISFYLVEPAFVFSGEVNKKELLTVREDFCEKIKKSYFNKYKNSFPHDNVRFLSRAQNISKYFPKNANCALIESLPPRGEVMKDFKKFNVEMKGKDLMEGMAVSSTQANALAFIPKSYAKFHQTATFRSPPHATLKTNDTNENFTVDFGCKLRSNGHFSIHFAGEIFFFPSLGHSMDKNFKLFDRIIPLSQLIPITLEATKCEVKEQMGPLPLTQEKITYLLERVNNIVTKHMSGMFIPLFIADYETDRSEALEYLSKYAGHHYRKNFCFKADLEKTFIIKFKDIPTGT